MTAAVAATVAAAGVAAPSPLPIQQRVLRQSDLSGFVASRPVLTHEVIKAVAKQPLSGAALRRYGFVALIREDLAGKSSTDSALSMATQFRTEAGAEGAAAAIRSAVASKGPWTFFQVPGIPRAYGFRQGGGSGSGSNVVFADGTFEYLVGIGSSASMIGTKTQASLITAARTLYRRVRGRPAP